MRHSFLKMVALAFIALGFVACGDDSAKGDSQSKQNRYNKQKAREIAEKLCDEGVSGICLKFAEKYENDEAKALAYYEKGCNGKDKYGEWGIAETCYRIADIYARKLEGDKAKQYYAKACEYGECTSRLKELDESLYLASKDLYDERKHKQAEARREKQEQLKQANDKSQEEPTQICENNDRDCKCENGDGKACNELGDAHYKFDYEYSDQAIAYYQKGCEYGYGKACNELGYMYREKKLDGKQSQLYYQKGCEYGFTNSCSHIEDIATLKTICDNGISAGAGCYYLGKIYEKDTDYKQAITYYAKSCELGFAEARDGCTSMSVSVLWNDYRDFESEAYWLGYHKGDLKKAKQSVKEIKQIRNEIRGELLKYLPNLCKTKGGKTCDLLWKIGN